MNRKLLLFAFFILPAVFSFAQKANKAYAITGQSTGNFNWTDIREIDLATGKVSSTIFESGKTSFSLQAPVKANTPSAGNEAALPTQSMVAAAAYDKRHEKLFFTPMRIGELRWLDLSSKSGEQKFYSLQNHLLTAGNLNDEANQITRMVIGSDGNGYAISNDANHLIRFTTGRKTSITDLGSLIDAPGNTLSVHTKTSWGGDIISDAYGKLYLFSASQNVFVIDIQSRMATWLGAIKNLAPTYTVNGAAVDADDNVVISSANTFQGFYKLTIKDLSAQKINTSGQVFNSSDLANANLLYEDQLRNELGSANLTGQQAIGNNIVSIYPNPVTDNQFKLTFNNTRVGKYDIALTDVDGKLIMTKRVDIKFAKQQEVIRMASKPAGGIYFIKVTAAGKKSVFADKIVIN